jgi:Na+/H+ antiporter NhaD/arsenite permease-like protein
VLVAVLLVAFSSTVACNVLNNQPMTILYTRILLDPAYYGKVSSRAQLGSMLALVLGSNLGANLTLIGALAGIMWSAILSDKGYPMSYMKFAKYGLLVTPLVTTCAALLLAVQVMYFPAIDV